jgi:hypothetical protein
MKSVMIEAFECEYCPKRDFFAQEIEDHEKGCLAQQAAVKKAKQERLDRIAEIQQEAIEAAKNDEPLALLIQNGLMDAAMDRVRNVFDGLWRELDSTYIHEETLAKMLNAAKEALNE